MKCLHCPEIFETDEELVDHMVTVEGYVENHVEEVDDRPRCPECNSVAYCCNHEHTDGPGPRLHCTSSSLHNFKFENEKWVKS